MKLPQSQSQPLVSGALSACRSSFWVIGVFSFVINVLMLTGPLFMLQVYDRVLASRSVPTLVVLGGLVVGLYAFQGLLEGVRSRMLTRVGQRLDARLSRPSFEAAVGRSLNPSQAMQKAEPVRDLELLRGFLASPGPVAIFDLPWMPIYLAMVFLLHPLLGTLSLGAAIVISLLIGVQEWVSRKPTAALSLQSARRQAMVQAGRSNVEAIAAMGMLPVLGDRWRQDTADWLSAQRKAADQSALFGTIIKTLRFMLQSALLGVGAWLVIRNEASGGVMIASSIISSRALAPVEQAVAHWRPFLAARQALSRLREVLKAPVSTAPATELPAPKARLEVQQAVIRPPASMVPTAQGLAFSLEAGDGLGVIGPSGSGKSSLARALVGVWPLVSGKIRLDGSELGHFDRALLGRSIGYLPQDVELLEGTIAENIARFDPDRSSEAVLAAAKAADVHELIIRFPQGYDTPVGENGARLSAGQRQRVALARALYGNPFLVVLDEPNSNLDAEGEAALTAAIAATRRQGSIVVVVAHRPSAVAAVDKLLFMKDGRQASFGPKEQVLAEVTAQAGAPRGPAADPRAMGLKVVTDAKG
ncbi:type I secretion system permease/ATPase [Stappia sp. F7233]|uniref:Type I secretion system permease/ATPase n=1 Tax=Stappia albiluteola TaxID=2758565 RepID=A0A839AAU2_9HYPH|nr:type I secretion system permease/ATPase [Stappia albiluteola]MBA5776306.1 type I secretion system permease/ATPase [Stappia albiluteola]